MNLSFLRWIFSRRYPATTPVPLKVVHHFYPPKIEIPHLTENETDVLTLLFTFATGLFSLLMVTWTAIQRFSNKLGSLDKSTILWFVLTGSLHTCFEGYFVYNHTRMGDRQDLFGQLWKEYALSDSRYLTADPFVVCIETITAFCWGPLSYLTAYFVGTAHSLRYPFQAIVATCHIYGGSLYFATSFFDYYYRDISYSRPEPQYFWFYFIFMNSIWIVIPGLLLFQSVTMTGKAFSALNRMSKFLQEEPAMPKSIGNGQLRA